MKFAQKPCSSGVRSLDHTSQTPWSIYTTGWRCSRTLTLNILQQRLGYMLMFTRRSFYYVYSVNFTLNKPNVLAIKILIRPITSFLFSLSETVRERESGENKMNPSRALSKFGVNIFWRMLLLSTIGSYTCIHLREWMNLLLAFIHLKLYSLKFLKLYENTGGTFSPNIQTISK